MWLQLIRLLLALSLVLAWPLSRAAAEGDERLHVGSDTLIYTDTDNVVVVSPQVSASYDLDDEGSQVGARVAVDAISAASVDVVSQATNRFSEVRTELGLSFAKEVRDLLPSISYRYSREPDYTSHGGHVGVTRELGSADTTLSAGYGITIDQVGRSGTATAQFSESLHIDAFDVSLSQVLNSKTILRVAYTLTAQRGYMEKPYRHVPLFTADGINQAQMDGVALNLDTFADYALSSRPPESVPDDRYRHAVSVRLLRFVPSFDASLKLDYQLYTDSWGVLSNLGEGALYKQFSQRWRGRFFARIYHQGGADFWQKTYTVADPGEIPKWRTIDRHLSPYHSLSGGGRVEWQIWRPLQVYIDAQAMHTTWRDALFIDSRLALIGQIGVRWLP